MIHTRLVPPTAANGEPGGIFPSPAPPSWALKEASCCWMTDRKPVYADDAPSAVSAWFPYISSNRWAKASRNAKEEGEELVVALGEQVKSLVFQGAGIAERARAEAHAEAKHEADLVAHAVSKEKAALKLELRQARAGEKAAPPSSPAFGSSIAVGAVWDGADPSVCRNEAAPPAASTRMSTSASSSTPSS